MLTETRERFAEDAASKLIEIQIDLQQPLPALNADRAQLDRVLDNLLENALRHTPSGGHIRLQARRHGERVIISIEDKGEGIAYGQQGRIFEPFVQVGRKKGAQGLAWRCAKRLCSCMAGALVCTPARARARSSTWPWRYSLWGSSSAFLSVEHAQNGCTFSIRSAIEFRGPEMHLEGSQHMTGSHIQLTRLWGFVAQ